MKTEGRLREEFVRKFMNDSDIKSARIIYTIADFWLSHRQAELEELVEKLEGEKRSYVLPDLPNQDIKNEYWNFALDRAIELIKGIEKTKTPRD